MNFGFFDGFPSLTRMLRSRFYMAEPTFNSQSGQVNNYQTIEVDAQEVQNCGLHIMLKGGGPLVATSTSEFIDSQTVRNLSGNSRGDGSVDWQRSRSAPTQVASGVQAVVGGGSSNSALGTASTVAGGSANTASNTGCTVSGGNGNTANGVYAWIPGGRFGATNARVSSWAFGTAGSAATGRQQAAGMGLVATTTNATAVAATADNVPGTLTGSNIFALQNNSAVKMKCEILARDTAAANDVRAWDADVVARRGANAAATTVDFTNIVSVFNTAGAAAWTIAVVTDTANGGFYFNVTGEAGKTIRWMVKIDGVEVA